MRAFTAAVCALSTWVSLSAATGQPVIDVTSCGDIVPARTLGILRNDLVCDGPFPFRTAAVQVDRRAELHLDGHTITGTHPSSPYRAGILAFTQATIRGPGVVEGFEIGIDGTGMTGLGRNRLFLYDLTLRGNLWGVEQGQGTIRGSGLAVHDNVHTGLDTRTLKLTNSTLFSNGVTSYVLDFVCTRRPRLIDVTCEHSQWGVCSLD